MEAGLTDHVWSLDELVRLLGPENSRSGAMKYRLAMWAVQAFWLRASGYFISFRLPFR